MVGGEPGMNCIATPGRQPCNECHSVPLNAGGAGWIALRAASFTHTHRLYSPSDDLHVGIAIALPAAMAAHLALSMADPTTLPTSLAGSEVGPRAVASA